MEGSLRRCAPGAGVCQLDEIPIRSGFVGPCARHLRPSAARGGRGGLGCAHAHAPLTSQSAGPRAYQLARSAAPLPICGHSASFAPSPTCGHSASFAPSPSLAHLRSFCLLRSLPPSLCPPQCTRSPMARVDVCSA
eukprot:8614428-Pyramimonas_sp.AAC.1